MPRVLLIGWDGADWRILDPLLERRDLPNLQGLIAQGQRAVLRGSSATAVLQDIVHMPSTTPESCGNTAFAFPISGVTAARGENPFPPQRSVSSPGLRAPYMRIRTEP
jgi:hypothetical protein